MEKKNTLLLTIITIATLVLVVVGVTYAYFAISSSTARNTSVDANVEGVGSVALSGGAKITKTISASDMAQSKAPSTYDLGVANIATATLTGESEKIIYYCEFDLNVTNNSNLILNGTTDGGININVLENVTITGENGEEFTKGENLSPKEINSGKYNVKFKMGAGKNALPNESNLIVISGVINNDEEDNTQQERLAGKSILINYNIENFECVTVSNESYNITYNLEGGEFDTTPVTTYNYESDEIILPMPTREGYTFTGWTGSNGETTQLTVTIPSGSSGNKNYVATWNVNTYIVKYNANGGSGTMSDSSHTYDVENELSANTFTKTDYTFDGWNTKADGTGTAYANNASVKNLTATNGGTVNLYAQWKTAFAVYSATDNSLTFYKRSPVPSAGSTYNGKVATAVYTGFETAVYEAGTQATSWLPTTPWVSYAQIITSVVFEDTIKPATSLDHWFSRFTHCAYIDVSKLDTSSVTSMYDTFSACGSSVTGSFKIVGLENWDTGNVTNMYATFYALGYQATSLSLDLSSWDTSNVTNMQALFQACGATSIDLSGWDTSKVTNMYQMFYKNVKVKTVYVSDSWSTVAVTNSYDMFYGTENIVGGAGTKYNSSYTDKTYARIDGGTSKPGYFTRKSN